ncbi:MAG TPA: Crp/Fnr family transcriptional regulator [Stellaceae bacterium]|nr:Crp/Fnr family transcriptional regulator [Stellaceae bacterium]
MAGDIDVSRISRLLGVVDVVSVRSGEFLFREGDAADAFYIVKRGVVQVISEDGITYETVGEGGIVGELAIVDEGTRSLSVRAESRAELVKVDVSGFLNLVTTEPTFSLAVMRVMSRRLRLMNRRYAAAVGSA